MKVKRTFLFSQLQDHCEKKKSFKKKKPTNSIHKQGDSDDYNFGTFDIFILLEIEFSSLFSISSLGFN